MTTTGTLILQGRSKRNMGGNWISDATKNKGALHRQMGVPAGQKIPAESLAKAAKAGGKLGKRARLAETLRGFQK